MKHYKLADCAGVSLLTFTGPWHEWTEHQEAPWKRTFSSRDPGGVRSIHARDL